MSDVVGGVVVGDVVVGDVVDVVAESVFEKRSLRFQSLTTLCLVRVSPSLSIGSDISSSKSYILTILSSLI